MKKLFLILLITFITTPCFARFNPTYDEAVLKGQMVTINLDEQSYMSCDVGFQGRVFMQHTYAYNRNFWSQQVPAGAVPEGSACITHIIFHKDDSSTIEGLPGYIGKGHAVVHTPEYQSVVSTKVKDVLSFTDEEGVYHEYTEEDANDPYPIWVFLISDYTDAELQTENKSQTVNIGE